MFSKIWTRKSTPDCSQPEQLKKALHEADAVIIGAEAGLESIAFCCISTGVFCFPNEDAAEIAVQTVKEFLQTATTIKKVIFNVFKDLDKEIYTRLLTA